MKLKKGTRIESFKENFMKKILLFLIVFIMLCTFTVRADEYTLYSGDAFIYNDFKKDFDYTTFKIKYDDVRETYYLYTYRDYSYDAWNLFVRK